VPKITVVFFRDENGRVPVREWLAGFVAARDGRALVKCKARLKYLRDNGMECRRPYADYLRDGIYELRAEFGGVNYRILYFFAAAAVAVVAAGLTKEAKVPDKDIDLARQRKQLFESDPERYSYYEQEEES
jgi:hypothetical protein